MTYIIGFYTHPEKYKTQKRKAKKKGKKERQKRKAKKKDKKKIKRFTIQQIKFKSRG